MFEDHMDFETALAKATELGYAEADPTADVEDWMPEENGDHVLDRISFTSGF